MTESILSHFFIEDDLILEIEDFISCKCQFVSESKKSKGWKSYEYKGKKFSIKFYTREDLKNKTENKRPSFLPGVSISFNWITDFKSHQELLHWLKDLFETYYPLIEESRVTRLDLPLHLKVPYSRIRNNLERPRTRTWREFISSRKSLYLGKKPKELIIYEETFPQEAIDYPKSKRRQK